MPSPNLTIVLQNYKTYLEAEIERAGAINQPQGRLIRDLQAVDNILGGSGGGRGGSGASQSEVQTAIELAAMAVPTITNLILTNANTQYTYTFLAGTKRYAFKCRADTAKSDPVADIRYSWVTGKVATGVDSYDVLPSNCEEVSQDYLVGSKAIYFSSAIAGVVLTIREWS